MRPSPRRTVSASTKTKDAIRSRDALRRLIIHGQSVGLMAGVRFGLRFQPVNAKSRGLLRKHRHTGSWGTGTGQATVARAFQWCAACFRGHATTRYAAIESTGSDYLARPHAGSAGCSAAIVFESKAEHLRRCNRSNIVSGRLGDDRFANRFHARCRIQQFCCFRWTEQFNPGFACRLLATCEKHAQDQCR